MSRVYPQPSIILKREVLSIDHVPEKLWHRISQLQAVAQAIEPLLAGRPAKTTLMYGPSGSGKTSLSKRFLETIDEKESRVRTAYVNCWDHYSEFNVMKALVKAFGRDVVKSRTYEGVKRLMVESCNAHPRVIVLDEMDQLAGKHFLHALAQLDVALILITNDDRCLYRLDERIKSRLGPLERVHFPPYGIKELQDIVEIRAKHALAPDSISKGQLRRIAAASGGNAHLAMESLRLAAERAEEADSDRIENEHVEAAVENARQTVRTKSWSRLNEHQKLLYRIIKEHGEIPGDQLQREFQERASEPVSERTVRNYLHKLEQYGFIRMKGVGRWRCYRINH